MQRPITLLATLTLAASLAACGGGGGSSGGSGNNGGTPPTTTPSSPPGVPPLSIGIALPTGAIGYESDPTWGQVGGFTQSTYSQVLAFPPGTTITLKNLSSNTPHTFNVIAASSGPPANFPSNPSLSTGANGGNTLAAGYSSGTIDPGSSVSVVLANAGTYLIGCAYHYASANMRDVIQVSSSATPGPQATPMPGSSAPPSGGGGGY